MQVVIDTIVQKLTTLRANTHGERELQDAIHVALSAAMGGVEREVQIAPGCRIDFRCGVVGIEVKTKGSRQELLRQVVRYLDQPSIEALVVVTRGMHHRDLPTTLRGKPLHVVRLMHACV